MNDESNEPFLPTTTIRHDGWTGDAMAKFLETLAETGIVLGRIDILASRHRCACDAGVNKHLCKGHVNEAQVKGYAEDRCNSGQQRGVTFVGKLPELALAYFSRAAGVRNGSTPNARLIGGFGSQADIKRLR